MPTYIHYCAACDYNTITDTVLAPKHVSCGKCGAPGRRVLEPPALLFDGGISRWHETTIKEAIQRSEHLFKTNIEDRSTADGYKREAFNFSNRRTLT